MFRIINIERSKNDNTIKYVFSNNDGIYEVSYIDKNDGKDIVCSPTQTSCNMGCKFCHLTGLNVRVKNIDQDEIVQMVRQVVPNTTNKTLLISYMGAGEPLANLNGVIFSAAKIAKEYKNAYTTVRFAVASIIPSEKSMLRFISLVKETGLNFKFHLSLHTTNELIRTNLLPSALNIKDSVALLKNYAAETGRDTEIHYALMDHINDSKEEAKYLSELIGNLNTSVKILKFSEKENLDIKYSERVDSFISELREHNIVTEMYDPPGRDIGASCGQFTINKYLKKK